MEKLAGANNSEMNLINTTGNKMVRKQQKSIAEIGIVSDSKQWVSEADTYYSIVSNTSVWYLMLYNSILVG